MADRSSLGPAMSCCSAKSASEMSRDEQRVVISFVASMAVVATCSSARRTLPLRRRKSGAAAPLSRARCRRAVVRRRFDRGTRVRRVLSDGSPTVRPSSSSGVAVPDDNDAAPPSIATKASPALPIAVPGRRARFSQPTLGRRRRRVGRRCLGAFLRFYLNETIINPPTSGHNFHNSVALSARRQVRAARQRRDE